MPIERKGADGRLSGANTKESVMDVDAVDASNRLQERMQSQFTALIDAAEQQGVSQEDASKAALALAVAQVKSIGLDLVKTIAETELIVEGEV